MKKKILILVSIVLLVLIILIGFIIFNYYKQEQLLKKEVLTLEEKDLFKDNYNLKTETKGNYTYIELTIKKYYKELSNNTKIIKNNLKDKDLSNIMTIENFKNDGTKFTKSQELLKEAIESNKRALNQIINLSKKTSIKNYIASDKTNSYYLNLYKELMYNDKKLKDIKETVENIQTITENLNEFYKKEQEILTYLANNDRHWEVKNEKVSFGLSNLADEYNKLYKELVEISKKYNKSAKDELPSISSI
jgi:hypothetical protein